MYNSTLGSTLKPPVSIRLTQDKQTVDFFVPGIESSQFTAFWNDEWNAIKEARTFMNVTNPSIHEDVAYLTMFKDLQCDWKQADADFLKEWSMAHMELLDTTIEEECDLNME